MSPKLRKINQGDIFMCNLSVDAIESEQTGVHPVLIASADIRNKRSKNVFVFPITHADKKYQPCHYDLKCADYPFFTYDKQIVLCEEGRSVSKNRLEDYLGKISLGDMNEILKCKEYVFVAKT